MSRGRAPSPQSNRVDMLSPAPITTVPGQGYGDAAAQQAAQHAVPMAGGATQSPGAPASSGASSPAPQGASGSGDLMAQIQAHNGPGDSMLLNRPTERPNEPVTHGLPVGPGGGPETLTGVGAAAREGVIEQGTLKNLLQSLSSQQGASSAIKALAAVAGAGVM